MEDVHMTFKEEIELFGKNHIFELKDVDGVKTKYLLCGNKNAKNTLVYLVGGTGFSDVWFRHICQMEADYRILTFDYPMEITDLEKLAEHIVKLIDMLGVQNPVLIGASLGGFMAQLIARRFPDRVSAVILYSTCSLSGDSIADLKKQYKVYGVLLKLMQIIPYSWIQKMLFAVSKKQVGLENEDPVDRAYMEEFFAWVYGRYTKEFDLHMTGLIADVVNLVPFERRDYEPFDAKSLLVLPCDDEAFSKAAQADLIRMMPRAQVARIKGGHTATLYKVDEYVQKTRGFLNNL